jgi:LysR family glycine cleavage system transcriptional activator
MDWMLRPLPPLQTLRAFIAVARERGFSRAADQLGLTQTAVSHQIAQLEGWIGGRLFMRDQRRVELTVLGRKLLPDVDRALSDLQHALSSLRATTAARRLRLSTTPEFAAQWLTTRLDGFCDAHPDIDVSVVIEYRRARFSEDDIDLAIWLGCGAPDQRAERLLMDEEFAVCAPEVTKKLPKRNALQAAPLLRYEGARHTVLDWRRWCSQLLGIDDPKRRDESKDLLEGLDFDGPCYPTFTEMLEACRQGAGFALVRTSLVGADLASGGLVRCFDESLPSDLHYHLIYPPAAVERSEVQAFRDWIIAATARS